ncbi:hypothetical protein A6E92_26485 [Streptomyces sp. S8]|uniref:hypothetical protein n=1 Tax=Streptomyces sp. S8 TaxID=1837283 RepID=UPI000A09482D|nr:hypothetical protein [Streptomyces sp. S8]ARI55322.1 hypothetical protein A6E92_26485 [Streptomyces sp. S8]
MFEIRIICETPDRESVVNGLRSQFNIGRVRSSFSLTSGGERLYITANPPRPTRGPPRSRPTPTPRASTTNSK